MLRRNPLKSITFKYGTFVVVALVVLRVMIGWHFFKEGAKKFTDPNFSAIPFLEQAKGPVAGLYQMMIPDPDGRKQLDYQATGAAWLQYHDALIAKYNCDEKRIKKTHAILDGYLAQLRYFLDENEVEIQKFEVRLDALNTAKKEKTAEIENRRDWIAKETRELRVMAAPWLATIRQIREDYRQDLLTEILAEPPGNWFPAPDPAATPWLNFAVKWTVILVGIFLLLGLFTRFWCLVGIGFLCSVISTQWPGAYGAVPVYYQAIELCALLVLLTTSAGRFAGLDFFLDYVWQARVDRKEQEA